MLKTHAAEDDDIDFRLHGDAGQKLIVRFAGDGEDRQFLGFDQRVEDVDHRDARSHHVARDDAPGGVDGGAADVDRFALKSRASVAGLTAAVEDAAQEVVGKRHLHVAAKEAHFVVGGDASCAGEDLQRHKVAGDLDDLGQRGAALTGDFRELVVAYARGGDRNNAACYL